MKKIFIIFLLGIFLIGIASAQLEFDNVKSYDSLTKTVTVKDNFGLGGTLATIKLDTPQNVYVIRGEDRKVAEFTIDTTYNSPYSDVFKKLEFYDLKKSNEKFTREFTYKYKTQIPKTIIESQTICSNEILKNGTSIPQTCYSQPKEVQSYEEKWIVIDDKTVLPIGKTTIGIFTDIEAREHIEWIPNFYGVDIPEWAEWTEALNVNLLAYYNFEIGTGNIIPDVVELYDLNMTSNSSTWVTGKVGTYAMNFSRSAKDYAFTINNITGTEGNNWSVNGWYKLQTTSYGTDPISVMQMGADYTADDESRASFWINYDAGANTYTIASPNNPGPTKDGSVTYGSWVMLSFMYDVSTTNLTIYENGVLLTSHAQVGDTLIDGKLKLAKNGYGEFYGNMQIDEVGVWNRSLSSAELTQLYNGGSGLTYQAIFNDPPTVTLNNPTEAENFTTQDIIFNATVSDDMAQITNASLILNGVINQTNVSVVNNTQVTFSLSLADGIYNYTYIAYDNFSEATQPSIRNFTIDTTNPQLSISAPTGNITYHQKYQNLSVNWTVLDVNLDPLCIIEYPLGFNKTVTCSTNGTFINISDSSNRTVRIYSNDTFGNQNITTTTWQYLVFLNNETYNATTIEVSPENFKANVDIITGFTISSANLWYNNTPNAGSITANGGNNFDLSESINTPDVSANTNKTFFWSINLESADQINTTAHNQTVQVFAVDNCSSYSILLLNLTLRDEEAQTIVNATNDNSSIEVDLNISTTNNEQILTFSQLYSEINPAQVCLNIYPTGQVLDATIKYSSDPRAIEYYNLQDTSVTNDTIPQNINLYDLLTADSTEFQITFKDSSFTTVEDAIILINRQYVSEGVFKTVEVPKTDSNGQSVAHLVQNDIIYNMIVLKNGEILGTFNNLIAFCEDATIGNCYINLNAVASDTPLFEYDTDIGIASTFTYNTTNRLLQYNFVILDGSSKQVDLLATKLDQLGTTTACNETLTSASGTISCTIPSSVGNETVIVKIYVDNEQVLTQYISAGKKLDLGYTGYFLALVMILSLGSMLVSSKKGLIIGSIMGIIASLLFGFVNGTIIGVASALIWLIIWGIILIFKLNSDRET